jgi:hypothetical protein
LQGIHIGTFIKVLHIFTAVWKQNVPSCTATAPPTAFAPEKTVLPPGLQDGGTGPSNSAAVTLKKELLRMHDRGQVVFPRFC